MENTRRPKNVIYGAWCVCHPEAGIRYVGQTSKGVTARAGVHLWCARTESSKSHGSHFSNWIRKHGERNVAFSVLEVCLPEELDEREISWIEFLTGQGAMLTNLKPGGRQARGHRRPDLSVRMAGPGNPSYGSDRREIMAYARSFQGPPSKETRAIWSEQRRGEGNGRAVLNDEIVREIRSIPFRRGLYSELSRKYGVSVFTIVAAYKGKTWKHVE